MGAHVMSFQVGQRVFVDEDILLGRLGWGDSYTVTVREDYGPQESGTDDHLLSVVCDNYGHEHDVLASTLQAATLEVRNG